MARKTKTKKVDIKGLQTILSAIVEAGKSGELRRSLDGNEHIATIKTEAFDKIVAVAKSTPSIVTNATYASVLEETEPGVIYFPHRDFK